jgi:hypothetical protein
MAQEARGREDRYRGLPWSAASRIRALLHSSFLVDLRGFAAFVEMFC